MLSRLLTSLSIMACSGMWATAAPLPAALEKYYKDGITPTPDGPTVIRGMTGPSDACVHLVRFHKGQSYDLAVAAGFGAQLRVEDAATGALQYSTTTATGNFVAPRDGLYRIMVNNVTGGAGKYALTLDRKVFAPTYDPPGTRLVGPGGLNIMDALGGGDAIDKVRRHPCKIYTVRLTAGKNYVIDMMSGQFDCFLRLEDPAGKQLAMDDDGGEGLNSRLMMNVPTSGAYRIICTSFSGGGGAFTLQVRER